MLWCREELQTVGAGALDELKAAHATLMEEQRESVRLLRAEMDRREIEHDEAMQALAEQHEREMPLAVKSALQEQQRRLVQQAERDREAAVEEAIQAFRGGGIR